MRNALRRVSPLALVAALALVGLVARRNAQAQQATPPAEPMRIERVKENLYLIRGPWNPAANDALLHEPGDVAVRVTPDGLIVIDDKFPQHTQDILALIRTVSTLPIKYLLNTHHHADHAGGDANFIGLTEIIAHRNVRENMIRNRQEGAPRIVFSDQMSVFLGNVEVGAVHLGRGHTNGDSVIYFRDLRTIHAGDLVIDGMPFIDYDNGGTALEWPKTLDRILELDFDTIIPGHGRLLTKDDLRTQRGQFERMNAKMRELVQSRMPKPQATAALKAYLREIGWDNTVSTATFLGRSLDRYYDEIAASVR
jgi:glyoxylase-like metal-dependent hydrolase (beta-lactamase superfamily II)